MKTVISVFWQLYLYVLKNLKRISPPVADLFDRLSPHVSMTRLRFLKTFFNLFDRILVPVFLLKL